MSNALTIQNGAALAQKEFGRDEIELIKKTVAVGATDLELKMFLHYCSKTGLDPIGRQIYCIKRGDRATIQTGIDGLRLVAARTGEYAGNDDAVFEGVTGEGYPEKATATVYRIVQGHVRSFSASARWTEYAQYFQDRQSRSKTLGDMWARMPYTMLAKCAEALALRKAFPAEMGSLYTQEEMMQADVDASSSDAQGTVGQRKATRTASATTGEIWEGPGQCPNCHAPAGKPHSGRCDYEGEGDGSLSLGMAQPAGSVPAQAAGN